MRSFKLTPLLGSGRQRRRFYRYGGSLTTPPCYQTVVWTIMYHPVTISERQLNQFRKLKNAHGEHLVNNFRPTQAINRRIIYRHH
ncbi:carbonic anhydrase family protein [Salmonella sp. s54925]|uniref:carbonic anhydrase family protein n=1 Tax=Salmonella sp. s54925 TaxID=3159674 RepID=UPI003980F045